MSVLYIELTSFRNDAKDLKGYNDKQFEEFSRVCS